MWHCGYRMQCYLECVVNQFLVSYGRSVKIRVDYVLELMLCAGVNVMCWCCTNDHY